MPTFNVFNALVIMFSRIINVKAIVVLTLTFLQEHAISVFHLLLSKITFVLIITVLKAKLKFVLNAYQITISQPTATASLLLIQIAKFTAIMESVQDAFLII